jgi:hypothetical protein
MSRTDWLAVVLVIAFTIALLLHIDWSKFPP